MTTFLYILSSILLLYIIQIVLFTKGISRLSNYCSEKNESKFENKKQLSILIPFKNEKNNLNQLVRSLKLQSLPFSMFEVIFINDNSNDNSESILKELIKNIPNFKLINSKQQSKKGAINEGIKSSKANLIVTTDADCIHQETWLEEILTYYLQYKPKMIVAPVLMTGKTFFQKLQSLDFLSLTASTAGACGIKHPIMCNGANLIYEKKVFEEFNDALNNKELSGDDIFLLHNVKKKYPNEIHYLKSKEVIVYTEAETSISSFFNQRIRWASKSKSYKDFDTILSALIILGTNLLIVILSFLSIFYPVYIKCLFAIWGLKTLADLLFLIISGSYFKQKKIFYLIPILSILYPFYVSYIAFISFFTKNIKWKTK